MRVLQAILGLISAVLTPILALGRNLAWMAMGLMVVVILVQVFCRYILNAALPWPDELARFLMLWLTGLIAATAYRSGGFVAIEMIPRMLPRRVGAVLLICLLIVSLAVLVVGFQLGLKHVNSGWLFASSSLKLPLHLVGGEAVPIKLAWMYMSLPVGLALLIAVNIELVLRALANLIDPEAELPEIPGVDVAGAE